RCPRISARPRCGKPSSGSNTGRASLISVARHKWSQITHKPKGIRFRPSTKEMCCTLHAFKSMSVADLCRRYSWNASDDEWIDRMRDQEALDRYDPARC